MGIGSFHLEMGWARMGGLRGSTGGMGGKQDLLYPLEMKVEYDRRPRQEDWYKMRMRLGEWIGRRRGRVKICS